MNNRCKVTILLVVTLIASSARAQYGWSGWQQAGPIAVQTQCIADPTNARHSIVSARIENTGSDRFLLEGRGITHATGLYPGRVVDVSYGRSKDCSGTPDFKLKAQDIGDEGYYRIEYKNGKLQAKHHDGGNLMAFGAALQGAAAGMSGAPAPTYPTSVPDQSNSENQQAENSPMGTSGRHDWALHDECVKETVDRDPDGTANGWNFVNVCAFRVIVHFYMREKNQTCWKEFPAKKIQPGGATGAGDYTIAEIRWTVISDTADAPWIGQSPFPPPGQQCSF